MSIKKFFEQLHESRHDKEGIASRVKNFDRFVERVDSDLLESFYCITGRDFLNPLDELELFKLEKCSAEHIKILESSPSDAVHEGIINMLSTTIHQLLNLRQQSETPTKKRIRILITLEDSSHEIQKQIEKFQGPKFERAKAGGKKKQHNKQLLEKTTIELLKLLQPRTGWRNYSLAADRIIGELLKNDEILKIRGSKTAAEFKYEIIDILHKNKKTFETLQKS